LERRYKLLVDTDIGNDIDDAIALTYALSNPAFEILGVTTVKRNGELRARLVKACMEATGQTAPVAIGDEVTGIASDRSRTLGQLDWAEQHAPPLTQRCQIAEDLIYQTAKAHPKELYLIALGPLTNVARAFLRYPELPEILGGLYLMGGEIERFRREHNFANDYLAADFVLNRMPHCHVATWGVGARLEFGHERIQALRSSPTPGNELLLKLIDAWDGGRPPLLFDIIPFLWLERPSVIQAEPMHLRVETLGAYTRGVVVCTNKPAGLPIEYCTLSHLASVEKDGKRASRVATDLDVTAAYDMISRVLLRRETFDD